MSANVASVIVTSEGRRGKGTEDDPVRVVYSLWTLDGKFVCDLDSLQNGYDGIAQLLEER